MQVVIRNFIKLLSAGAFNSNIEIEEMSEFKWKQLLYIAKINKVDDIITSGIIYLENSSDIIIPSKIEEQINKNIFNSKTNVTSFAYNYKQSKNNIKKFSNPYLNKKLNKIIFEEVHCIDTSIDSLTFLTRSIDNVNNLLSAQSYLRDLILYGIYLRECGNKIDFIKIDRWFNVLKMKKIMNLISQYLISYFYFETDEIPFYKMEGKNVNTKIKLPFNTTLNQHEDTVETQNESNGLIYNIPKPNTSMFRYFSYFPIETLSIFCSNIFRSLSNIEE